MATVNLGAIKFNWRGAYNNATAYVADDVVSSGGNSYVCILASTGNAVSNGTYWSLMAQAGTDGTDGTDVGLGTAGQVLKTNSGASAIEWGDAGGAWSVKSSGTFSAVSSFEATNLTKTTQVILYNLNVSSSYESIYGRVSNDNGSSWQSGSSTYKYINRYCYNGNNTITDSFLYSNGNNEMLIAAGAVGSGATDASVVKVTIYDPANTSKNKMFEFHTFEGVKASSTYAVTMGTAVFEGNTSAIDAIQVYSAGSGKTITGSYKVLELN